MKSKKTSKLLNQLLVTNYEQFNFLPYEHEICIDKKAIVQQRKTIHHKNLNFDRKKIICNQQIKLKVVFGSSITSFWRFTFFQKHEI